MPTALPLAAPEAFFQQALQGTNPLVLFAACFLGGVVSSLLPCTVSMMPVVVGYMGGFSSLNRWVALRQILAFVGGLSLVLSALGVMAALGGQVFGTWLGPVWYLVLAVLCLAIGLSLLEVWTPQLPPFLLQRLPKTLTDKAAVSVPAALLLGVVFGIVASPCGTPYLAGMLAFVSQTKQWGLGLVGLFLYGLGQGLPLILLGMMAGAMRHLATLRQVSGLFSKLSGVLFIALALWLGWFALSPY